MRLLPTGAFGPVALLTLLLGQAVLAGPAVAIDFLAPMPVLGVAGLCCLYPAHTSRLNPLILFLFGVACDLLSGVQLGTVPLTLFVLRFAITTLQHRFATAPPWFYPWVLGPLLTAVATVAVLLIGVGFTGGQVSAEALAFQMAAILLLYPVILQSFVLLQYLFEAPAHRHEAR